MDKTQLSQLPVPLRRGTPVRSRDDNIAGTVDSSDSSSNNMAQCRALTESVDSTHRRQPVHSPTEHLLPDSPPQRLTSKQQLRAGGLPQSRSPKRCGRSTTEDVPPPPTTTTTTMGGSATQLAAIAAVHARSGTVSPVSDASSVATSLSAADSERRTPEMYRKASTEFCRFDQLQKLKGCSSSSSGGAGEKSKKKSGFFGAGKSGSPSRHRSPAAVDDFYQSFRGSPIVATEIFPPDMEDVYIARNGKQFPIAKPQSIALSPERSKCRPLDSGGNSGGVDVGNRKYDAAERLMNFVCRDVAADQSGRTKKTLEKRSADGAEIIEEAGRENDNRNGGSPIYHELDPPGVYRFPTVHHTYQSIVELRDELESLRLRSPPSVDFQRSVADQPGASAANIEDRDSRSPLSRAKSVQELGQKVTPSKLSLFSRIRFSSKNKQSKTAESGSGSRGGAEKAVPPPSLPLPHPPAGPAQSVDCRLAGQRSVQDRNELSPQEQFFDDDEEDEPTSPHRRQPSFSTFMGRTQYMQQQQQYMSTSKPDQPRAQKTPASGIYSVVYIPHSSDDKTSTVSAAAGAVSPPARNSSLTRPSTSTNTYASSRRQQPSGRPTLEHIYQPILGGFGGSPKMSRGQSVDSPTGNEPLYRQKFLKIASVHSLCSLVNGSQLHSSTSLGNLLLPSENCRSPTLVDGARSALRPTAGGRQRATPTAFDDYYAVAGSSSTSKRPSIAMTSSPAMTPPAVTSRTSRSIRAGISPCRAASGNSGASSSSAFASPSCGVRMAEMRVAVRRVVGAGSSDVGGGGGPSASSSRSPSATGVDTTLSGSGHASTPIPSSPGRLSVFQFHVPPPQCTRPSTVTSHLPRRAFRDVSSQTTISVRPAASCSVLNVSSHSTVSGSTGGGRQMHTIQEEEQLDGGGGETLIVVGAADGGISGASPSRKTRLDRDGVGLSQRRRNLTAAAADDGLYRSVSSCRQDSAGVSAPVNDEKLQTCPVPIIAVASSCQHSSKADRRLIRSPRKTSPSTTEMDARCSPGHGNNGGTCSPASLLEAGDSGQKASRLRRPSPAKNIAPNQQSTADQLAPASPSALSSSSSSSASAQTNIDHRLLTGADRRSELQQQQQQKSPASGPASTADATAFTPSRLQSTRSASSPRTPRDRPTCGRSGGGGGAGPARASSAGAPQSPGPRGHSTSTGASASGKPSRTATTVTERHQSPSLNNDRANGFHAAAAAVVVSAAAAEAIENNKSGDCLSVPDARSATEAHCSAVTTTRSRPPPLLTAAHAKQAARQQQQQQQSMSTSTSTAPSSSLSSSSSGSLVSAADCSESDELTNSLTTSGDLTTDFAPSSSRSPRDLAAGERDSARTEDDTLVFGSESPVSLTGSNNSCSISTEKSRTFLPKMSAAVSSVAAIKNKPNKKPSTTNGTSR